MFSIIFSTFHLPDYLKLCIDSILENSYFKDNKIFVHVNDYDEESIKYLENTKIKNQKNIDYISTDNIGEPEALNLYIDNIDPKIENTIITNDDCYFSRDWDYNLNIWIQQLNLRFPNHLKFIGYRWCEPTPGSFPPICNAGKNINEFNLPELYRYISEYSKHEIGDWFPNSLYPTKILKKIRFDPLFNPKPLADIDFIMQTFKYLNNDNIPFLIFGVKDVCVYHFQRIGSLINRPNGEIDNSTKFEEKWKFGPGHAWKIIETETKRSIKLVKEE